MPRPKKPNPISAAAALIGAKGGAAGRGAAKARTSDQARAAALARWAKAKRKKTARK